MRNGNYITLSEMMYRIRRHPLLEDALKSDIALDIYDVLRLVGAPGVYKDARKVINIENFLGDIPDNILYIKEINHLNEHDVETPMSYVIGNKTSKWHCTSARDLRIKAKFAYSLNPGKIHTDLQDGKLAMYYKSIQLDEEGFPMIPDDPALVRAVISYVKMKHIEIKVDLGIVQQHVLHRTQQDYYFDIAQAESRFKMPGADEWNSIARSMLRLIHQIDYDQ